MSKAITATLAVAMHNATALEAACIVLKSSACFRSCAELAKAVREACDEIEASDEARAYLEEELGIAIR